MKILIVAPYCSLPGEGFFNRFLYIAEMLARDNHNVCLVTSRFRHFDKKLRNIDLKNFSGNLEIILLHEPGYSKNVTLMRLISHYIFIRNLDDFLSGCSCEDFDLIYSAYPLIASNHVISKHLTRLNAKLVIDVQDIWPESFSSVVSWFKRLPRWLMPFAASADKAYSSANALVAVSQTYLNRARFANKSVPSMVLYIGASGDLIDKVSTSSVVDSKKINAVYLGTISHSYDLITVVKAFEKFERSSDLVLHVVGDGPLVAEILAKKPNNVIFHGVLKYLDAIAICKSCNFAINPIKEHAQQTITNKLSDYFYIGIPILNSQRGEEVEDFFKDYLVIDYKSGDIDSCFDALRKCAERFSRMQRTNVYSNTFDRRLSYPKLIEFIEKL